MDPQTLADVIDAAKRGDAGAFDRLVEAFGHRIFGFLYRMSGSRPDAEDLMQEVFVRLVRMIGAYQHDGRFESWLFRIAANLARDRIRRIQRGPRQVATIGDEPERNGSNSWEELPGAVPAADAGLIRGEEFEALGKAIAQLPDGEREVIMLRHFSQMSFKEIAEATGTPLGTALARAHRGLARLRELMSQTD
jgi:RNA polymerase sigma-70 factor (ECF subfamily)